MARDLGPPPGGIGPAMRATSAWPAEEPDPISPEARVLGFVDALRRAGVPVALDEAIAYLEALRLVGIADAAAVRRAGRATLTRSRDDLDRHDEVFAAYWTEPTTVGRDPSGVDPGAAADRAGEPGAAADASSAPGPAPGRADGDAPDPWPGPGSGAGGPRHGARETGAGAAADVDAAPVISAPSDLPSADGLFPDGTGADDPESDDPESDDAESDDAESDDPAMDPATDDPGRADDPLAVGAASASRRDVLRAKDLGTYTEQDWAEAERILAALRLDGPARPGRRRRAVRRGPGSTDLRRTVRAAHRHGGEILRIHAERRTPRPRRVVLLLDISGSMQAYERGLLRVAHAAVTNAPIGRVEVFTAGTRLTRITRELTGRDPRAALAAVAAAVPDLSGGTRLGTNLRRFNDTWSAGLARGAVVVVVSDGWERGDPTELGAEMARLHRVAHQLVWVNPLKATEGYEPLARGMAAALPHVDRFVSGHSLDALDELAALVAGAVAPVPIPERGVAIAGGPTAGRPRETTAPATAPAPTTATGAGVSS